MASAAAPESYAFAPEERPVFPGSPYSPTHPPLRRVGYALIALLTGITSNLVNSMVTVNLPNLAGAMGLYVAQVAWFPAVYVAFNATANLTLVRARIQFGIPAVMHFLLVIYGAAVVYQLILPSFPVALFTRAMCGMTMAALSTITLYNLMQVFSAKTRPLALLIGISIPQLGLALARLIPVEALALDGWRGLHLIELGLILAVMASTIALPVPPTDRTKAFEPFDAITIGLMVPGFLLVCAVLSVGRYLWWTDTPWLGVALAAAVPLLAAAILFEHFRARPLIQTRWIGTADMLRFALIAFVVRVALAEQTYGSVGLLTLGGLINDQLHLLFMLVVLAMIAGVVVAALTLKPDRIPLQIMAASLCIALGAWMDTDVSNLTRPPQLYASQMLIAFGTTLFIGPSLLFGILRVLQRGPEYLVTFVVLFSATQNLGGLAGSALLGSLQYDRVRYYTAMLSQYLDAGNPIVVQRLQAGAAAVSGVIVDPAQRTAQGGALLSQALAREANLLAFADVFRAVALIALANAVYLAIRILVVQRLDAQKKATA
ncbi:MFS transporter [Sphingomonas sp. AP4-R1]|uniref:MFS transporter n=1 Tax=Sphingomonas sp. AP4-R1 TaxID=2735134 RepID=UPI00149332AB|nr:MFS transporter [Sphingomonas sp. AP4-R1]QJU60334.1 MFS transporter [Sphingomonas sp. AP4-R1]